MAGTALVLAGGFGAPACAGQPGAPDPRPDPIVPRFCAVGDDWRFAFLIQRTDGVTPYDLTHAQVAVDVYLAYAATPFTLTVGAGVFVADPPSGQAGLVVPNTVTSNAPPQDPYRATSWPTRLVIRLAEQGTHRTIGIVPLCAYSPRTVDAMPPADTSPIRLAVAPLPAVPLQIGGTPGPAYAHVPFSFTPTLRYGGGSRAFTLTGTLPDGWSFDPGTGTIGGTTTAAQTLGDLAITVTDDTGPATLDLGITVAPYPALTLVSAPTLSTANPRIGDTIAASHGVWADVTGAIATPDSYNDAWRSAPSDLAASGAAVGNTTTSYTVQPSDAGHVIGFAESATKFGVASAIALSLPSGAVPAPATLSGSIPGQGTLTGAASTTAPGSTTLTGAVPGQGTLAGTPSESAPGSTTLTGAVPGQGTLTGNPSESAPGSTSLQGNVPGQGTLAGTPTETAAGGASLQGNVPGQGVLSGTPTETAPGSTSLQGNVPGQGTLSGTPTEAAPGSTSLQGNVPGQGSLSGTPSAAQNNGMAGYFFPPLAA